MKKTLLLKILAVIVPLLLLGLFFSLQFRSNGLLRKELNNRKEEFKKIKAVSNRLTKLEKQFQDIKRKEEGVNSKIPYDEKEPLGLIKEIIRLGNESGLNKASLNIIDPQKNLDGQEVIEGGVKTVNLELTFSSGYQQLIEFLEKINNLGRLVGVEKVEISRDAKILPNQRILLRLVAYSFTKQ